MTQGVIVYIVCLYFTPNDMSLFDETSIQYCCALLTLFWNITHRIIYTKKSVLRVVEDNSWLHIDSVYRTNEGKYMICVSLNIWLVTHTTEKAISVSVS